MFTSRLTVFAMCVTILKAENSGDSSVLILAQIHVPKHFCEGSTPFLKHACYEQCLLLKGRAQWEAAGPGGSCCVEGLVEGRLGTLSECRRADCAISQEFTTLHFSPPPLPSHFCYSSRRNKARPGQDSSPQGEVFVSARGSLKVS